MRFSVLKETSSACKRFEYLANDVDLMKVGDFWAELSGYGNADLCVNVRLLDHNKKRTGLFFRCRCDEVKSITELIIKSKALVTYGFGNTLTRIDGYTSIEEAVAECDKYSEDEQCYVSAYLTSELSDNGFMAFEI